MAWLEIDPALVTLALVVGAILFARRFGGSAALAELERANRVLTARVVELERENAALHHDVSELRMRTDVAQAVAPVAALLREQHGEALGRFDRMTDLLGMVADRLGPDPNGHE